ncbi:MAG TPA: WD40 repeat domain-containing protein, partial [Pirellulaceae bacterium]|nr:WD40 repeat domain-containing protein [Pirellulaceae bacterium]
MTARLLFDLNPRPAVVAGQSGVARQEAETAKSLKSAAPEQQQRNLPDVSALAISPDSRIFVTGESRGVVRSWDAKTGAALQLLQGRSFAVTHIAFQSASEGDELKAYIGYADGRIVLWDVVTGRVVGEAKHGDSGSVSSLVVSADGRTLVTASPRRDRRRQGLAGNPSASGADGESQKRGVTNSSLWVWDAESLALVRQIPLDSTELSKESISFVSFRANSTVEALAVTTSVDQARPTVWSWPLQSGSPKRLSPSDGNWRGAIVAAIETPAPAMKLATSGTTSATRMLTVGGNAARLWSLSDRLRPTRDREFRPHGAIQALDVSRRAGEHLLVTAGADGSARLWDLDQHAAVRNLTPR